MSAKLHLTDTGHEAMSAADAHVSDLEADIRAALGPEGADELRRLLERLISWRR